MSNDSLPLTAHPNSPSSSTFQRKFAIARNPISSPKANTSFLLTQSTPQSIPTHYPVSPTSPRKRPLSQITDQAPTPPGKRKGSPKMSEHPSPCESEIAMDIFNPSGSVTEASTALTLESHRSPMQQHITSTLEQATIQQNPSMTSSNEDGDISCSSQSAKDTKSSAAPEAVSGVVSQNSNSNLMLEVADFYNDVDVNVLIFLVAEILECLTAHNNRLTVNPANITRFHSKRAPDISIIEYLRRIVKHGAVNRSCLLSILVYMDRMCFRHNMFMISSLTVHRFIITAVTVSSKAHSDTYFSNRVYADVGGIPLRELNTLELDTLFHLNWDLQVTSDRLQTYYVNLIKRHKGFFFSKDRNEVMTSGAPVVGQTTA